MTVPSRYRGLPVSEGIGLGAIYLGDAPGGNGNGDPAGRNAGANGTAGP
jgi:hypothetical protein